MASQIETYLKEMAHNNYIKAENVDWLDNNAPQLFSEEYPDANFLAITETPPKTFYTFKSKRELLGFIVKYPYAAFRYRGFEQEIYML